MRLSQACRFRLRAYCTMAHICIRDLKHDIARAKTRTICFASTDPSNGGCDAVQRRRVNPAGAGRCAHDEHGLLEPADTL
jgi:hypothetical protein